VLHLSGAGIAAPASTTVPVSMTTTTTTSSYVVQPGDTLTAIASRAGVSPASLAAANGLALNGVLVSGTVLRLSGSSAGVVSSASAAASQPVGAVAEGSPTDPPYPTPERVTAPQVGSIAAANGVPAAMAAAGYFQGLPSVQQHGMYPDTQQYVQNVLSLERQFGGGG